MRWLGLLLMAAVGTASADEPPTMMNATKEQEFLFLAGAAQGIGYTNTSLILAGKAPLYCAPDDFVLGVEEMRRMAEQELAGPHEPTTFVLAAISVLQARFPCE